MKIALLGAGGFVGSALSKLLIDSYELIGTTRESLDVCDTEKLENFLEDFKPDIVLNATGKVAGIQGNIEKPASLFFSNLNSSSSVMNACIKLEIRSLVQFSSACIYPLAASSFAKPEHLNTGVIETTSASYATAKLMTIQASKAVNEEYGFFWTNFVPTNLYGPGDWKSSSDGHVIAMLVDRFLKAVEGNDAVVEVWGDGQSQRNFLHIEDLASAVQHYLMRDLDVRPVINLSGNEEFRIVDIAGFIAELCGFRGKIHFNKEKPNGARRKNLDDSYWRNTGWVPQKTLFNGLKDYIEQKKFYRV
jgi:GDP-L-fucose synthase